MDEEQRAQEENDEINLLDCVLVLLKRKRLIITVTLGLALLTAVWSLITPKIYKAETKILPPQQSPSMAGQLMGQLMGDTGLGNLGALVGVKSPGELYVALLKSRTVLDSIIDKFSLMNAYRAKYRQDARLELLEALTAQEEKKSGIITLGLEDRDPRKAAEMANAFIDELRRLNKELAMTEAGQRRLFYEDQLKDAKESLLKAEESMKGFQEASGAIKPDDQAKAVIEGIAYLQAQIAAKEVQLKVMRTYATVQNPDIRRGEEELKGLREQLNKLQAKENHRNSDPLIPTGRMPQLGAEYVRQLRDLKYNEALYAILLRQFEAAKLDEGREATVIQVIEKAIPPETRTKPRRTLMVMVATIVGFFVAVFAAFLMEYTEKSRNDPRNKERFELLRQYAVIRRKNKIVAGSG